MKTCKIIGLTGQTGAGKSTVANALLRSGAMVISADELVSELYYPDSPCLKTLSAVFGAQIIKSDGQLDRKALAEIAFSSKKNTALLNSLIHPFVLSLFLKKADEYIKQGGKYVIFDAPQLFESRGNVFCDYIISVVANKSERLQRICSRDGISERLAEDRINAQLSEEFFIDNSDLIIENNGSKSELEEKAARLASTFMKQ